ncbi:MAG: hypothetical protein KDE47_07175 [Caldilineaceae bacterium]|nr:hypothetical protein [Caldilineaceae bacterium]
MSGKRHGFKIKSWATLLVVLGVLLAAMKTPTVWAAPRAVDDEGTATDVYLPITLNQQPLANRIGFGITGGQVLNDFTNSSQLKAGIYLDWLTRGTPTRPDGIQYAQMVRVHQKLECGDRWNYDRVTCPYVQPTDQESSYNFWPSEATIKTIAQANRGSLWLVGNEIERKDWLDCGPRDAAGKCIDPKSIGQDEILPETYAIAYHQVYNIIKAADPTAQVAIGGVIQATPLRLEYLTRIWDYYEQKYGEEMPVDVWNFHSFILPEKLNGGGAEIPTGLDATEGAYSDLSICNTYKPKDDPTPFSCEIHIDIDVIDEQVRALRQWMKDRGQQEKPLINSEYGALFPNTYMGIDPADAARIHNFMLGTFDYFLNTKDCDLGWHADDCRLVQRWVWYSLENRYAAVNPYTTLLNPDTGELTEAGQKFRQYAIDHYGDMALP